MLLDGDTNYVKGSLLYFVNSSAQGSILPFLPVFYSLNRGLSNPQIGTVGFIRPICTFICSPALTALADRRGIHLQVAILSLVAGATCLCSLLFCHTFSSILFVVALASSIGAGSGPIIDAHILAALENKAEWGKQRLWGAIGFGLATLLGGLFLQAGFSWPKIFAVFFVLVVLATVILVLTGIVQGNEKNNTGVANSERLSSEQYNEGMNIIMWSNSMPSFFFIVFVAGCCAGVIENFLFIFLLSIGAKEGLLGLARAVTCFFEVPFFLLATRLIAWMGVFGVLMFTMGCYALRLLLYANIGVPGGMFASPSWVLAVEPLHGVTYALMWSASCVQAQTIGG
eukprot:UC4_evm1s1196